VILGFSWTNARRNPLESGKGDSAASCIAGLKRKKKEEIREV